jgi:ADP-heptose:LPS heptosyltransferase
MTAILVVAEWSSDFSEHFIPLVDAIRARYPSVTVNSILHRVQFRNTLPEQPASSAVHPFDGLVVTEGKRELAVALAKQNASKVFVFVKHCGSPADDDVCRLVPSIFPDVVFLLRNLVKLRQFWLSGEDQAAEVRALLRRHRKRAHEIWLKVRLVYAVGLLLHCLLALVAPFRRRSTRKKILFMRLDVLGDMVLSLPALLAVRQKWPDAEITVVASRRSGIIVEEQQRFSPRRFCDRLVIWQAPWHEQKEPLQGVAAFFRLLGCLVRLFLERYDLVLQPVELGTGVFLAAQLMARQTVTTIAERLPLARVMARHVQGVRISPYRRYHIADLPALVAEAAGCDDVSAFRHNSLLVSQSQAAEVSTMLVGLGWDRASKLAVVNIGAGSPNRRWHPAKYAELVRLLGECEDLFPVVVGGTDERELGAEISSLSGRPVPTLVGQLDLNQLVSLLALAEIVVTPDTGVMHIAAELDRKIVAIYGAGLVPFCRPLCSSYVIVKKELGCSGCGDLCFQGGEPPCIAAITVDMVLDGVASLLD